MLGKQLSSRDKCTRHISMMRAISFHIICRWQRRRMWTSASWSFVSSNAYIMYITCAGNSVLALVDRY